MTTTKAITLYNFDELSESAQDKVVENMWEINVDYDWWEFVYYDAESIGIKIKEFDLYRGTIKGDLWADLLNSINSVLSEHGESTDTYSVAKSYLEDYEEEYKKWIANQEKEGCEDWSEDDWYNEFKYSEEVDNLALDYRKDMLETYRVMLNKEYDYLTSKEAIVETILANEYNFTEDGSRTVTL